MNLPRFFLGLALTAVAGAIDAVSFVRFGAVYASFMSGNTIQFGIHLAEEAWPALGYVAVLVSLFMLGGCIGGIAMGLAGRWSLVAILAMNSLAVAAGIWVDTLFHVPLASTAPLSFAMGAQNHLVVLHRGANPGTTFVTGTAFRFGDAVAQRLMGRDPHGAWRFHLVVWAAFGFGAALGTIAQFELTRWALVPVLATLVALTLAALAATIVDAVRARRGAGAPAAA